MVQFAFFLFCSAGTVFPVDGSLSRPFSRAQLVSSTLDDHRLFFYPRERCRSFPVTVLDSPVCLALSPRTSPGAAAPLVPRGIVRVAKAESMKSSRDDVCCLRPRFFFFEPPDTRFRPAVHLFSRLSRHRSKPVSATGRVPISGLPTLRDRWLFPASASFSLYPLVPLDGAMSGPLP